EYNSPIYRGHQPKADAACVTLLRQAGCLILGKTVTTEFANNHPSQTRNPHNRAHTPGGSSSGSAAAVADLMVPAALGTQTGGSVIRPAAYCGAFAIKPSFGAINRAGAKFVAESLDTIGIFARSAEDLGLCLEVLTGRSPSSASGKPRIGLCRTPRWSLADASTQKNVEDAARQLAGAGAKLREVDFLLTPSAPSEAPATLASTGDPVFNRAWTLFGVPCVTVPCGTGAHGLPLAVQLVGAMDTDMALLGSASWATSRLG